MTDALYRAVGWLWNRLRPREGWLSFFLLAAVLACYGFAISGARWTPEIGVVWVTMAIGLLLGTSLAQRHTPSLLAWTLLLAYLLIGALFYLAELAPWQAAVNAPGVAAGPYARQQLGLLADRIGGYLTAVSAGGSSAETVVFSLGYGLLAGLLAAYLAWSTYYSRRVLLGLTLVGLGLALNGYFARSGVQAWLAALYLALAALATAALQYAYQEADWEVRRVDHSGEIRLELLLTAAALGTGLLFASFLLPALPYGAVARAFQQSAPIQQTEETLDRVFAGVREPATRQDDSDERGVLPRAFLLGNTPELAETVVFTATTEGPAGLHWRAVSYDRYTGRGWARSEENSRDFAAGVLLPLREYDAQVPVTQTVAWQFDERRVRYTQGLPTLFATDVTTFWRGVDDLVMVLGPGQSYAAESRLSLATPAQLRGVDVSRTPPAILARYTQLPAGVPVRVGELAAELTAQHANPYDQARSIEQFLRQYPYSLEIGAPPPGADPVDYFLFDLQTGYCDYYASAMVVLARSAGLPARIAIGYLNQPPDTTGVQTVYRINAHSWAEVYFAGYGWIEFEPTAPFPVASRPGGAGSALPGEVGPDRDSPPPAIPERNPASTGGTAPALLLLAGLILAWFLVQRRWGRRPPHISGSVWAYDRLTRAAARLGSAPQPSETPAEFAAALLARLDALAVRPVFAHLLYGTRAQVERIIALYTSNRYARQKPDARDEQSARSAWLALRRRFWLAGATNWLLKRRD